TTTTTTAAATTTATTTTTAATTTTATTTTTTTAPPPMDCPGAGDGPVPAAATEVSAKPAELDGDDLSDTFTAYLQGETWHLHAALGSGYSARLALDAAWAAEYYPSGARNVRVDGAFNLGNPTNQVMSVRLYTGLGIAYGLFTLEDCAIVPLLLEDGTLPGLWQGMGPAHSDWPVCGPGRTVLQVTFSSTGSCTEVSSCATPDVAITEYRVARGPARLLFVGETSRASTAAEFDDLIARTCVGP
ncbi:MAG: hypothetical protein H6Q11_1504, partial [Acidobacteria bacterium]|nr:hypothetical protein [Acidobacteriota bacterium]